MSARSVFRTILILLLIIGTTDALFAKKVHALPLAESGEKDVFYCSSLSDMLSIATHEELSIELKETDEEYFERIMPFVLTEKNRCTVGTFAWEKEEVLCYWNGVTLSNPRTYGKKYIVKIETRSHPTPLYVTLMDTAALLSNQNLELKHCAS